MAVTKLEPMRTKKILFIGADKSGKYELIKCLTEGNQYTFNASREKDSLKKIELENLYLEPAILQDDREAILNFSILQIKPDLIVYCLDLSKEALRIHKIVDKIGRLDLNCPTLLVGTKFDAATDENLEAFKQQKINQYNIVKKIKLSMQDNDTIKPLIKILNDPGSYFTLFSPVKSRKTNAICAQLKKVFQDVENQLDKLSPYQKAMLANKMHLLTIDILNPDSNSNHKKEVLEQALQAIQENMHKVESPGLKICSCIAATLLVSMVILMTGIVIGLALSAWISLPAFGLALAAGSLAAIAVVGCSAFAGMLAGAGTAYCFFSENNIEPSVLTEYSKGMNEIIVSQQEDKSVQRKLAF